MGICSERDTIAAIATPPGQGGIGVVRISGSGARAVLERVWRGRPGASAFESHRLYYGPVGFSRDVIDRALVAWMQGPKSYTGEDVVEISGHGGQAVMQRLLGACCEAGARVAEPGEFTKRAFLNGKIDLAQAEAVADVIAASSEAGLKLAQDQLAGRLSATVNSIAKRLTELRAFVESSIDFPEEDLEFIESEGIGEKLAGISAEMINLSTSFDEGRLLREGLRVAIIGLPNAGKSTLFNKLVGRERAIVHHAPGTTRDVVNETVIMDGVAFHLHDTAGLRESSCEVERSGVAFTKEEIEKADVVLYVVDASDGTGVNLEGIPSEKTITVYNKTDLMSVAVSRAPSPEPQAPRTSALTGEGIDKLKQSLLAFVRSQKTKDAEGVVVTNARHRQAIDSSLEHINKAGGALLEKRYVEFIAEHLRLAHEALRAITGETATDAILEEIFARFCIGK